MLSLQDKYAVRIAGFRPGEFKPRIGTLQRLAVAADLAHEQSNWRQMVLRFGEDPVDELQFILSRFFTNSGSRGDTSAIVRRHTGAVGLLFALIRRSNSGSTNVGSWPEAVVVDRPISGFLQCSELSRLTVFDPEPTLVVVQVVCPESVHCHRPSWCGRIG